MSRRSHSTSRLLTTSTLAAVLSIGWALPTTALAAPPELPPEGGVAPAPAPAPEPAPVAVQPAPAPAPQPAPQPGWEQPVASQPPPADPWAQQAPPPTYQPVPAPQPLPPRGPNPNRGLGLMISGFSVFGISYLITAVAGTAWIDSGAPELGRPLLIPVAGPFIAGARQSSATLGLGLGFVGVIQLAGLGMGVGGAVVFGNARRQARLSASAGGLQLEF